MSARRSKSRNHAGVVREPYRPHECRRASTLAEIEIGIFKSGRQAYGFLVAVIDPGENWQTRRCRQVPVGGRQAGPRPTSTSVAAGQISALTGSASARVPAADALLIDSENILKPRTPLAPPLGPSVIGTELRPPDCRAAGLGRAGSVRAGRGHRGSAGASPSRNHARPFK